MILLALALLAAPDFTSEDSDVVIAACREAATVQDEALTAPLIRLLKHDNPAVRKAAIEALQLRKPEEERKKAAHALAQRIAPLAEKPETKEECLLVATALHDLAHPVALKPLLEGIGPDSDRELSRARLRAAANLPSKEVIDELLQLGSAGKRGGAGWRQAAVIDALRYATQENVKGGIEAWRAWWTENKKTYDADIVASKRAEARLAEQERRAKGKKGGRGDR
jgi:hypothetical protein